MFPCPVVLALGRQLSAQRWGGPAAKAFGGIARALLPILASTIGWTADEPGAVDLDPQPGTASAPEAPAPIGRKLDPDAMLRLVMDRTPAGINRRLGPDANSYRKLTSKDKAKAKDDAKAIWEAPHHKEGNRAWEIGGPWMKAAGDYSSTQGQIAYAAPGVGIDRVTILEMSNNTYCESPEPPWWGGSRPEPHSKDWAASAAGGVIGIARGSLIWSNCGVIVYANGLMCTAGTCTAVGSDPVLHLPDGKVPTSVCVTSRNEFALVTVVDIKSKPRKSQLAVVALTACKPKFFHEWQAPHPGMPSVAMYSGMKLLGFVDLPGMTTPTAVSAVGEYDGQRLNDPKTGNIGSFKDYDLANDAARSVMNKYVSASGWAIVAATYEDKIAFVDLQPLFQYYRTMYCTGADAFKKTVDQGPGAKQWPYTFEAEPAQQPMVVKSVHVPEPTAVLAGLGMGDQGKAYVGCRDGRVVVFKVGGLASEAPVTDSDIVPLEAVQVGRNPTCIAYQRYTRDEVVVVSRGDRELSWIKTASGGSKVIRRLHDARLVDPVACEVAETHGTETELITVCDFSGQKIVNYRYGELKFITNGNAKFGIGESGKDEFECGGTLDFPGPPFIVCAANVN